MPGVSLTSQNHNSRLLDQNGNGDSILETPLSVDPSSVKLSPPPETPSNKSVEAIQSADISKESSEGTAMTLALKVNPSMIFSADSNPRPSLASSRSDPNLLGKPQDTSQPPQQQPQRSLGRASSGTNLRAAFASHKRPSSRRLLKPDESTPIVRQPSRRRLMMMERANSAPNLFDKIDQENGDSGESHTNNKNTTNRRRRGQLLSKSKGGSKIYTDRNTSSRKSPTRTRRTGRRKVPSPNEAPSREEDPATYSSPRRQVSSRSASCRNLCNTVPVSPGRRNVYAKSVSAGSIHSSNSNGRAPRRTDVLARSRSNSLKSCGDSSLLNAKRPRRIPTNEEGVQVGANDNKNDAVSSSNSTTVDRWENPPGVHRRSSMDNASVASRPRSESINSINSVSSNLGRWENPQGVNRRSNASVASRPRCDSINSINSVSSHLSRWDNPEGAHRRSSMDNASVPRRPSKADDNSPLAPSRASSPTAREDDTTNNNDNNAPGIHRKGTAVTSNRSFKSTTPRDLPNARPRRSLDNDYDDKLPTTITTLSNPSRKPTATYSLTNDPTAGQDDRGETDSLLGYTDMEDMLEPTKDKFLPRNSNLRRSNRRGSMGSQASFGSFGSLASRRSRNSIGSFFSTSGASAAAQFQSRRASIGGRQLPTRAKSHCDGATRGGVRTTKKRALRSSSSVDTTLGIVPRNFRTDSRSLSPHQDQQRLHSGSHQKHMDSFAGVLLGSHSHSFRLRRAQLSQSDHQIRDRQKYRRSRSMDIKPSVIRRAPSPPTVGNDEDGVSVASFSCDVSGVISALDLEEDQDMTVFTTDSNGSNSSDDLTNSLRGGSLATRSFKSTRSYYSTGSRLSCSSSRKSLGSKKSNCSPLPLPAASAKKPPADIADLLENMESEGEYVIFIGDKKDLARVKGPDNDGDSDDGDDNSTYISGGAISLAPSAGSRGSFHNTSLTNMDTSGLSLGTLGELGDSENSDENHERKRSAHDANMKENEDHTVDNNSNVNVDVGSASAGGQEEAAGSDLTAEKGEDNTVLDAVAEQLGDDETEHSNNSDDKVQGEVGASNNEDQDDSGSSSCSGSSNGCSSNSSSSSSSSDSTASDPKLEPN